MANNYFKVFDENKNNIKTDIEYINLTENTEGFKSNTPISSSIMNTILRQCTLITFAVANMVNNEGYATNDIGPNSDNFNDYFSSFMKNYFRKYLIKNDNSLTNKQYAIIYNKTINQIETLSPSDSNGQYVLGINANVDNFSLLKWSDLRVNYATVGNTANVLKNFKNESTGSTIKFSFGDTTKTTFSHTIDTNPPTSVENSTNVTSSIAGKLITAIFESNGTTVKNSTYSTSSGKSTNLSGGSQGSIPYQSGTNTTNFLAKPSTADSYLLKMTNSGIPTWELQQKITAKLNSDNTLDITITNLTIS